MRKSREGSGFRAFAPRPGSVGRGIFTSKIAANSVPEFPITGGIQARGGWGMLAGSRHQGAWIVKRSQARRDIL